MAGFSISKKNFAKKQYTCAGRRAFIQRFADTGFKTKWCGVWAPPVKCFDYFAYSVNGTWLSPKNQSKCIVKSKDGTKHLFLSKDIRAEETVFAAKNRDAVVSVMGLKNMTHKKIDVCVEVEAAINIRTKDENWHDRNYNAAFDEVREAVTAESESGFAMFGVGYAGKKYSVQFVAKPIYKDHYPENKQRCFIAGKYIVRLELSGRESVKIPFIYAGSGTSKRKMIDDFDYSARNWETFSDDEIPDDEPVLKLQSIHTPDVKLDKAFHWSEANIASYVHTSEKGTGVFAGYPWFLEFWGRDSLWSALAFIDSGDFSAARDILRTLGKYYKKRIPCTIDMHGKAKYYAADTDPLFLIALEKYTDATGEKSLEKELSKVTKGILAKLELMDYVVKNTPEETWMDSIERKGSAVEIQALWTEALKTRKPKLSALMKKRINTVYWNKKAGFLYDAHSDMPASTLSANALVPVMFGQVQKDKAEKVMKKITSDFSTLYGVRTRSKKDKGYAPDGYHTGAVWGLTTGWASAAYFSTGMVDEGLACLNDMAADLEKNCGSMTECRNADTGELMGSPNMLWSHALFIHSMDSYFFGIKPRLPQKRLVIEPKIPDSWGYMYREGKRIDNLVIDVHLDRVKNGVRATVSFDKAPKGLTIELVLPAWVASVEHNKVKHKSNKISFVARKDNAVVGRI